MTGKNRRILTERDRHTLMKNRKICTDSNGMYCCDEHGPQQEQVKDG
jgi:hypothetical protein